MSAQPARRPYRPWLYWPLRLVVLIPWRWRITPKRLSWAFYDQSAARREKGSEPEPPAEVWQCGSCPWRGDLRGSRAHQDETGHFRWIPFAPPADPKGPLS